MGAGAAASLLVLASLFVLGYTPAAALPDGESAWLQWGGPDRNFRIGGAERGLVEWPDDGPTLIWRRELGAGNSGVVGDGQRLFTMFHREDSDVVVALDSGTGETLWSLSHAAPALEGMSLGYGTGPHSTPLLHGELLFTVGWTGRLQAVQAENGEERWSKEIWLDLNGTRQPRGYAASPLLVEEQLVVLPVGGQGQAVIAFDRASGDVVWRAGNGAAAYSSCAQMDLARTRQIVCLLEKQVVGLQLGDGAVLWSLPIDDARYVNTASPVQVDEDRLLVVGVEGGTMISVRRNGVGLGAEKLWQQPRFGSQVGNALSFGTYLVGTRGTSTSYQTAIDTKTGETLWRDRSIGDANLLRIGASVLLFDDAGTLHLARPSRGGLGIVDSAQMIDGRSWTAPTWIEPLIVVRSNREIAAYSFKIEPAAETTP